MNTHTIQKAPLNWLSKSQLLSTSVIAKLRYHIALMRKAYKERDGRRGCVLRNAHLVTHSCANKCYGNEVTTLPL
jgi:hypothetical protein